MRAAATRPSLGCIAVGAMAALVSAQGAPPAPATKRLLLPPLDDVGTPTPIPREKTLEAAEVAAFPLGLHFGMSPEDINKRLAKPLPSVAPAALKEVPYLAPADVLSLTVILADVGEMKPIITACFGAPSRVVFMFTGGTLYAMSFRFEHDDACRSAAGAADDLFQRLLTIPPAAMPSERYRVGDVDVVDVWDKSVDSVVRRRWRGQ